MPLLPTVGRKNIKIRSMIIALYLILSVGSVTMVYPFALMLSGSISSFYDYDEYRLIPRYLYDDAVLFAKYIFEKTDIQRLSYDFDRMGYDGDEERAWIEKTDLTDTPEPLDSWLAGETSPATMTVEQGMRIRDDFNEFRRGVPDMWRFANWHQQYNRIDTYVLFQEFIRDNYTLETLNNEWGLAVDGYDIVYPPGENPEHHSFWPLDEPLWDAWATFKQEVMPPDYIQVQSMDYVWHYFIRRQPVGPGADDEIESSTDYNRIFGTDYDTIASIRFPREAPDHSAHAAYLYELYLREWLPATMATLASGPEVDAAYAAFLENRYGTVDLYNDAHPNDPPIAEWTDVTPSSAPPEDGRQRRDWQDFMLYREVLDEGEGGEASIYGDYFCRLEWIEPRIPEAEYAEFLKARYGDVQSINDLYGWELRNWAEVTFPIATADQAGFFANRDDLRQTFLVENYADVSGFIMLHGRAMWNTIILVILVIGSQLTVNPMAAYALSRFRLKYTNQILLFLLATMAFPAEVAMIPNFLMIKELGLLNTFWALVLPGVANGFGIFLLKGFFDSLPPELYEAGIMDGATEMTMFWRITLPLSKPILAVLALGAFTMAYGEFMYAFLVCQKREMWTLMVFLYEFQQQASVPLVLTSLVLASIPTLLVFVFCQNIILRGIVVPSFK